MDNYPPPTDAATEWKMKLGAGVLTSRNACNDPGNVLVEEDDEERLQMRARKHVGRSKIHALVEGECPLV